MPHSVHRICGWACGVTLFTLQLPRSGGNANCNIPPPGEPNMNDMAAPAGEYAFKNARFGQSALQTQLRYKGLSAISRYQPILSLAHRRPVGFEALVGVS